MARVCTLYVLTAATVILLSLDVFAATAPPSF